MRIGAHRRGVARALPKGARRVVLAMAGISLASGCSWIFVQPLQPDYESRAHLDCTTNRDAPIVDTILAVTNVGSAIYVAGENNVANKTAAVSLGFSVATVAAISAVYGYTMTSECQDAKESASGSYRYPEGLRARPQFYPQPAVAPPSLAAPPKRGTPGPGPVVTPPVAPLPRSPEPPAGASAP